MAPIQAQDDKLNLRLAFVQMLFALTIGEAFRPVNHILRAMLS
jgi:hypothetical protein